MTEKIQKIEKKKDVSREEFDNLCAKVRVMSDNWHKFVKKYVGGDAENGSIKGSAKVSLLICVAVVSLAGFALASGEIENWSSTANGTLRFNRVSTGVNSVEADTFIGAISATTVSASGNITITDGVLSVTEATASTAGSVTIVGGEGADAKLVLDADDGDDGADKWTLESEANGNDLSILNDTTEVVNVTSAGAVTTAAGITASTGDLTATAGNLVGAEASVDGKYAVTGGDATTGLMIQKASITSTDATLQTNSFAVAFGAAPVVVCTYTEDPGDVRPIFISSVTASNFIASVTADKNFAYVAVGTRP